MKATKSNSCEEDPYSVFIFLRISWGGYVIPVAIRLNVIWSHSSSLYSGRYDLVMSAEQT